MNSYRTRRATVDDLEHLIALWKAAHLPADRLEKEFTDFQIAEDATGRLIAAIGLQIEGAEGKVHSESYADFGLTDPLRPILWERLQVVAQNHGLFRVWTKETAPWWKRGAGFTSPAEEVLENLPPPFGMPENSWLMLRLKDEGADPALLDREFAAFKESERIWREKIIRQGRIAKVIGTLISVLLFLFAISMLFFFISRKK